MNSTIIDNIIGTDKESAWTKLGFSSPDQWNFFDEIFHERSTAAAAVSSEDRSNFLNFNVRMQANITVVMMSFNGLFLLAMLLLSCELTICMFQTDNVIWLIVTIALLALQLSGKIIKHRINLALVILMVRMLVLTESILTFSHFGDHIPISICMFLLACALSMTQVMVFASLSFDWPWGLMFVSIEFAILLCRLFLSDFDIPAIEPQLIAFAFMLSISAIIYVLYKHRLMELSFEYLQREANLVIRREHYNNIISTDIRYPLHCIASAVNSLDNKFLTSGDRLVIDHMSRDIASVTAAADSLQLLNKLLHSSDHYFGLETSVDIVGVFEALAKDSCPNVKFRHCVDVQLPVTMNRELLMWTLKSMLTILKQQLQDISKNSDPNDGSDIVVSVTIWPVRSHYCCTAVMCDLVAVALTVDCDIPCSEVTLQMLKDSIAVLLCRCCMDIETEAGRVIVASDGVRCELPCTCCKLPSRRAIGHHVNSALPLSSDSQSESVSSDSQVTRVTSLSRKSVSLQVASIFGSRTLSDIRVIVLSENTLLTSFMSDVLESIVDGNNCELQATIADWDVASNPCDVLFVSDAVTLASLRVMGLSCPVALVTASKDSISSEEELLFDFIVSFPVVGRELTLLRNWLISVASQSQRPFAQLNRTRHRSGSDGSFIFLGNSSLSSTYGVQESLLQDSSTSTTVHAQTAASGWLASFKNVLSSSDEDAFILWRLLSSNHSDRPLARATGILECKTICYLVLAAIGGIDSKKLGTVVISMFCVAVWIFWRHHAYRWLFQPLNISFASAISFAIIAMALAQLFSLMDLLSSLKYEEFVYTSHQFTFDQVAVMKFGSYSGSFLFAALMNNLYNLSPWANVLSWPWMHLYSAALTLRVVSIICIVIRLVCPPHIYFISLILGLQYCVMRTLIFNDMESFTRQEFVRIRRFAAESVVMNKLEELATVEIVVPLQRLVSTHKRFVSIVRDYIPSRICLSRDVIRNVQFFDYGQLALTVHVLRRTENWQAMRNLRTEDGECHTTESFLIQHVKKCIEINRFWTDVQSMDIGWSFEVEAELTLISLDVTAFTSLLALCCSLAIKHIETNIRVNKQRGNCNNIHVIMRADPESAIKHIDLVRSMSIELQDTGLLASDRPDTSSHAMLPQYELYQATDARSQFKLVQRYHFNYMIVMKTFDAMRYNLAGVQSGTQEHSLVKYYHHHKRLQALTNVDDDGEIVAARLKNRYHQNNYGDKALFLFIQDICRFRKISENFATRNGWVYKELAEFNQIFSFPVTDNVDVIAIDEDCLVCDRYRIGEVQALRCLGYKMVVMGIFESLTNVDLSDAPYDRFDLVVTRASLLTSGADAIVQACMRKCVTVLT